jgi:hypothetical protein
MFPRGKKITDLGGGGITASIFRVEELTKKQEGNLLTTEEFLTYYGNASNPI